MRAAPFSARVTRLTQPCLGHVCSLYVMCPSPDQPAVLHTPDSTRCKVGTSRDVSKRRSGLQAACGIRLDVLVTAKICCTMHARLIEGQLHFALSPRLVWGEWFELPDSDLAALLEAMVGVAESGGSLIKMIARCDGLRRAVSTDQSDPIAKILRSPQRRAICALVSLMETFHIGFQLDMKYEDPEWLEYCDNVVRKEWYLFCDIANAIPNKRREDALESIAGPPFSVVDMTYAGSHYPGRIRTERRRPRITKYTPLYRLSEFGWELLKRKEIGTDEEQDRIRDGYGRGGWSR